MKFDTLKKLAQKRGIKLWRDDRGVVYQSLPSGYSKKMAWLRTNEAIAKHLEIVPEIDIWREAKRVHDAFLSGATDVVAPDVVYDTVAKLLDDSGVAAGKTLETVNGFKNEFGQRYSTYILVDSDWV